MIPPKEWQHHPGVVLQANRTETLAEAVFERLRASLLRPYRKRLSWSKATALESGSRCAFAARFGIFAATCVELSARFLWREQDERSARFL